MKKLKKFSVLYYVTTTEMKTIEAKSKEDACNILRIQNPLGVIEVGNIKEIKNVKSN